MISMDIKKGLVLAALATLITGSATACTLFSATGSDYVKGGGSLIVKNRDWRPEWQEMRLVEGEKYRYYGIFTGDMENFVLRGGVNEKGLAVVVASASTIPLQDRKKMAHAKAGALKTMLGECASVDEALSHTELFLGPKFLMLADAKSIAYVEIANDGKYEIRRETTGTLVHTNHYVEPDLLWANIKAGASSHTRYDRITELLRDGNLPYSLDDFITFSQDQHDGPARSIWRRGISPTGEQTLATLAIYIPEGKAPQVYVKIRQAPDEQDQEKVLRLDGADLFPQKEKPPQPSAIEQMLTALSQWWHKLWN